MKLYPLIFLLAFYSVKTQALTNGTSSCRLSRKVLPISYSITLVPEIDQSICFGKVIIEIDVTRPVKSIKLHGRQLNITYLTISGYDGNTRFEIKEQKDLIFIKTNDGSQFSQGSHKIEVEYSFSLIQEKYFGLAKAPYVYKNNVDYLIASDFEAPYARRAFPCFDEPEFKTRFKVKVGVPNKSYVALSNMNVLDIQEQNNKIWHTFNETVEMSTYHLAIVVTKQKYQEYIGSISGRNIPIRSYSVNAEDEKSQFVMTTTEKLLNFFENYTGIPYPINKVDLVEYDKTLPATEYWGLTLFRTGFLSPSLELFDEYQISIILAHEITHYWFGNLVTNNWWDDIWLQEGFAQYFSLKSIDVYSGNTRHIDSFPYMYFEELFNLDKSNKNVQAIVQKACTIKEIEQRFSTITYTKAGGIVNWLASLLGEEHFQELVVKYLKKFAYKTATTSDFLKLIDDSSGNILEFMETWLYQNRFPTITVSEDNENNVYVLKQQPTVARKNHSDSSEQKWTIPILYTTNFNNTPTTVWFKKDMDNVTIPRSDGEVIILNYKYFGLYYVNYALSVWHKILNNINELRSNERAILFVQASQMFYDDQINCDIALKLLRHLEKSGDYSGIPSYTYIYTLNRMLKKFDQPAAEKLKSYYFKWTKRNNKREVESRSSSQLRSGVPHRYQKCAEWLNELSSDN